MTRFMAAWSLAFLTCAPAFADTFNINVDNGETVMLLVSIKDMNYPSPTEIWSRSISPGQMFSVQITGENGHNGHIQWTAYTADRQKCGTGDKDGLSTGANVTVKASSSSC